TSRSLRARHPASHPTSPLPLPDALPISNFALEQGRPVLAVPGNITSPTSAGTNNLIKTGATPVTSAQDVFYALGLEPATKKKSRSEEHTSELQSRENLVCRLLLEKKKPT